MSNPLLELNFEPALERLGNDYYDEVSAAEFPQHILRFRNDQLLPQLGLQPSSVSDHHFIESFGKFHCVRPFLALRYHGYQFNEYNPNLGDGRGFLYGQVRGIDGKLYDFGTKGSGRTPYARNADGRLTLKGGVREVLAAEMLHRLGVKTSRCFSMIETGESLWRGDEPSPTRSCVMVRFSWSHIRFGSLERLHYFRRPDLTKKLLNYVIEFYYPELLLVIDESERLARFYEELVKRTAELAAQWMVAGFCHGVLNSDNMSITGESFDYGPYAFIPHYNPQFTAAYFDYFGLYCYGNQPHVCRFNLERLQQALAAVITLENMQLSLRQFEPVYYKNYRKLMLQRLGFLTLEESLTDELLKLTLQLLRETSLGYEDFWRQLREQFHPNWREDVQQIFSQLNLENFPPIWETWRQFYYHLLQTLSWEDLQAMSQRLKQYNPLQSLTRPVIESVWESIVVEDNWQPFYELIQKIQAE